MAEPAYITRGNEKVKTRQRCPGSGLTPTEVVSKGKTYKSGNKVKGERPTGKCPECFEVFSLSINGNSWVLRRHSSPEKSNDKYLKVSYETWELLNAVANAKKIDDPHQWADDTLKLLLQRIEETL